MVIRKSNQAEDIAELIIAQLKLKPSYLAKK
jgi:hypothetical protein